MVRNEIHVRTSELIQFRANSLKQRCDTDRFFNGQRHIANSEFNRIKERMHTKVPPNFLRVVNTICFNKKIYITLVGFYTFKMIRNTGAGKLIENFSSETFETGYSSFPKRRIGTESVYMGKKIASRIRNMNCHSSVFHSYVNV